MPKMFHGVTFLLFCIVEVIVAQRTRTARGRLPIFTENPISERAAVLREFLRGQSPEFIQQLQSLKCDKYLSPGSNRVTNAVSAFYNLFDLDGRNTRRAPVSSSLVSINELPFFKLFQNHRSRRSTHTEREIVASAARVIRKVRQELYRETNEPLPIRRLVRRLVDDPPDFMTQMAAEFLCAYCDSPMHQHFRSQHIFQMFGELRWCHNSSESDENVVDETTTTDDPWSIEKVLETINTEWPNDLEHPSIMNQAKAAMAPINSVNPMSLFVSTPKSSMKQPVSIQSFAPNVVTLSTLSAEPTLPLAPTPPVRFLVPVDPVFKAVTGSKMHLLPTHGTILESAAHSEATLSPINFEFPLRLTTSKTSTRRIVTVPTSSTRITVTTVPSGLPLPHLFTRVPVSILPSPTRVPSSSESPEQTSQSSDIDFPLRLTTPKTSVRRVDTVPTSSTRITVTTVPPGLPVPHLRSRVLVSRLPSPTRVPSSSDPPVETSQSSKTDFSLGLTTPKTSARRIVTVPTSSTRITVTTVPPGLPVPHLLSRVLVSRLPSPTRVPSSSDPPVETSQSSKTDFSLGLMTPKTSARRIVTVPTSSTRITVITVPPGLPVPHLLKRVLVSRLPSPTRVPSSSEPPAETPQSSKTDFSLGFTTPKTSARRIVTVPTSSTRITVTTVPPGLPVPHLLSRVLVSRLPSPTRVPSSSEPPAQTSQSSNTGFPLSLTTPARRIESARTPSTRIMATNLSFRLPNRPAEPTLPGNVADVTSPSNRINLSELPNHVRISTLPIITTVPTLRNLTKSELLTSGIGAVSTPSARVTVTTVRPLFTGPRSPTRFTLPTVSTPVRVRRPPYISMPVLSNRGAIPALPHVTIIQDPAGTLSISTPLPVSIVPNVTALGLLSDFTKSTAPTLNRVPIHSIQPITSTRSAFTTLPPPVSVSLFPTSALFGPSTASNPASDDEQEHLTGDLKSGSLSNKTIKNTLDRRWTLAEVVRELPQKTQPLARSTIRVLRLSDKSMDQESIKRFGHLLSGTDLSDGESLADTLKRLNMTTKQVSDIIKSTNVNDDVIVELIRKIQPTSTYDLITLMRSISNRSASTASDVFKALETPFSEIPTVIAAVRDLRQIDPRGLLEGNSGWNAENRAFVSDLVKALHPNDTGDLLMLVPLLHSHNGVDLADILRYIDADEDAIVRVILEMPDEFSVQDIGILLQNLDLDHHQRAQCLNSLLNEGRITYPGLGETTGLLPTDTAELELVLSELKLTSKDTAVVLNSMPFMTPERLGDTVNHLQLRPDAVAEILRPPSKVRSVQDLETFMKRIRNLSLAEKEVVFRSLATTKSITRSRVKNVLNRLRSQLRSIEAESSFPSPSIEPVRQ